MSRGLASHLLEREIRQSPLPRDLPQPSTGCLVLDEKLRPRAFPGGPLTWVREPVHYLDLGGIQATSLREFGGSPDFWGGVTKLYASHCGLQSLDGIEQLGRVIWLYLDNNQLCEAELLRLLSGIPAGQLKALDLTGNLGCTDEVLAALEAGGLLASVEFLNGARWKPSPAGPQWQAQNELTYPEIWDSGPYLLKGN